MRSNRKGQCAAAVISWWMLTFFVLAIGAIDASDNQANGNVTIPDIQDRSSLLSGLFSSQEANPALLGFDRTTNNALTVPLFPSLWIGWWSNHLAVMPYTDMADSGKLDDYINVMLDRSFNTSGLDPGQASNKIMDDVADGIRVCARTRTTALALTTRLGSFAVRSFFDAQMNIPRGVFALVFGDDQGLVPGNSLDFKELKAEAVAYSTISAAYGREFISPRVKQFINRLSYGYFDFTHATWGLGIDYVIGHAFMREKTLSGSMKVAKRNGIDAVEINGQVEMIAAGGGVHGKWKIPQSMGMKDFFPGNGIGMHTGIALKGPRMSLDLSLDNLGFIRWGNVKKVVYMVSDTSVELSRLLGDSVLQTRPSSDDTLKNAPALYQSLPLSISLTTAYSFPFGKKTKNFRAFSQYVIVALDYDQYCTSWPTRSFIPRISLCAEDGALFGFVPIRCGFSAGGSEGFGSNLGVGVNTRFVKFDFGYTAFGTPYFYSKRGMAVSANMRGMW